MVVSRAAKESRFNAYKIIKNATTVRIYMNDMPSQVRNGKLLQYTDDTALICTGEDYCGVHNLVTTDLQYISNWIPQVRCS